MPQVAEDQPMTGHGPAAILDNNQRRQIFDPANVPEATHICVVEKGGKHFAVASTGKLIAIRHCIAQPLAEAERLAKKRKGTALSQEDALMLDPKSSYFLNNQ